MGYPIQQNQTAQPLLFLLVSSADHISPVTGVTPTVALSKNGGSFASPSGAVSELANGWYKIAGNATDASTLGPLVLHATATGADPTDDRFDVVAYNPQDATRLGLTALPNANAGANGGLPTGNASGQVTVATNNDKTGYALTNAYDAAKTAASSADYTAARAAKLDNLDAAVTSRLAGATYSAPPTTAAIVAAMDASSADLDTLIGNLSTLLARLTATRAGYLDNLTTPPLTATQTANAVLDGAAADHNTAGSIGAKINAAGTGADPLANAASSYPSGTMGYYIVRLGQGLVSASFPVLPSGEVVVYRGMDYKAAYGWALDWTQPAATTWPDLTGATVVMRIHTGPATFTAWPLTVVTPTGDAKRLRGEPTSEQTLALSAGRTTYAVWATLASGDDVLLVPASSLRVEDAYHA